MVEFVIVDNVFLFFMEFVVVLEYFYQEEFYICRVYNFIIDFFVFMLMKVKQLRNWVDEDV